VRGKGQAFHRVLKKTNADLRDLGGLETGRDGYHEKLGPRTDEVYDLGYRHKHQDPSECAQCGQCMEWYHEVCREALEASCQELGCTPHYCNLVRETKIHFGRYVSGNAVMKSGHRWDLLIRDEGVIGWLDASRQGDAPYLQPKDYRPQSDGTTPDCTLCKEMHDLRDRTRYQYSNERLSTNIRIMLDVESHSTMGRDILRFQTPGAAALDYELYITSSGTSEPMICTSRLKGMDDCSRVPPYTEKN
jgi:hypothetical protein